MLKYTKLEDNIINVLEHNILKFSFIIVTLLAITIRLCLFNGHSGDMDVYLIPWFEELKAMGGIKGLSANIGNYNAPYMTIIS